MSGTDPEAGAVEQASCTEASSEAPDPGLSSDSDPAESSAEASDGREARPTAASEPGTSDTLSSDVPPPLPDSTSPPADSTATPNDPGNNSVEATPTTEQATPSGHPPQPVFQDGWSSLSRNVLVDKVKGIIYGQAIGDALGLATEFMTKKEAALYYGKEGPKEYSQIVHDFHRSRWEKGDWTDDTDQLLLILQMIVERGGVVDKCAFAEKMNHWRQKGFQELGDHGGMGIGMTTAQTLSHGSFLRAPHEAAREVWERSGRYLAANGAVMRTAILGVLEFNDLERVVDNTREVCLTTHADPRCLASCVAVTTAIALMLQGKYDPQQKKELERLVTEALAHGQKVLQHKDQSRELETHVRAAKLKELDLENRNTMGYTFKAVGAGFYGLRTALDFLPTLRKIIAEAGDADSNGAVCGALMGCKFGFKGLPETLVAFPHKKWLDGQVEQFLATIGLKEQ